jgi:site-specific recombinase XerD
MTGDWKISLYNVKIGRRYAVKLHIADETTRTLWASVTDGMVTGERIFQDTDGERLRKRMIRMFPADAFGETLSPHSLRHLKATTLANQGIPVKTAAAILDCTPAVLVSVYTTVQQDDVDRAMGCVTV